MSDTEMLLSQSYAKILEVNLATDEFTALCLREDERIRGRKFSDWATIFAEEGNVAPEDREQFEKIFNSDFLLQEMLPENTIKVTHGYQRLINGEYQPVQALMFKSTKWTNETPIIIVAVHYLSL